MDRKDPVVQWLLEPTDPAIRYRALTDLLGLSARSAEVRAARAQVPEDPHVRDLLADPQPDGGFSRHPYQKWFGAHWRLVSLVDLGIPAGHPACLAAAEQVLDWLSGERHRRAIKTVDGRVRRCGSQEGNALGVCVSLGLAQDPRVELLADSLVAWQWPDGGWNCDRNPAADHSSFHESVKPLWGLLLYHQATGDAEALAAAQRTAELLLEHRLFRSSRTGEVIQPTSAYARLRASRSSGPPAGDAGARRGDVSEWMLLHWPAYWHYDILTALDVLRLLPGSLQDPRAAEALALVRAQRLPDGKWRATGKRFWSAAKSAKTAREVTNWGRAAEPSKPLTLQALRVLQAAG